MADPRPAPPLFAAAIAAFVIVACTATLEYIRGLWSSCQLKTPLD